MATDRSTVLFLYSLLSLLAAFYKPSRPSPFAQRFRLWLLLLHPLTSSRRRLRAEEVRGPSWQALRSVESCESRPGPSRLALLEHSCWIQQECSLAGRAPFRYVAVAFPWQLLSRRQTTSRQSPRAGRRSNDGAKRSSTR